MSERDSNQTIILLLVLILCVLLFGASAVLTNLRWFLLLILPVALPIALSSYFKERRKRKAEWAEIDEATRKYYEENYWDEEFQVWRLKSELSTEDRERLVFNKKYRSHHLPAKKTIEQEIQEELAQVAAKRAKERRAKIAKHIIVIWTAVSLGVALPVLRKDPSETMIVNTVFLWGLVVVPTALFGTLFKKAKNQNNALSKTNRAVLVFVGVGVFFLMTWASSHDLLTTR